MPPSCVKNPRTSRPEAVNVGAVPPAHFTPDHHVWVPVPPFVRSRMKLADVSVADERICALIQGSWRAGIMEEVRARELSIHNTGAATKTYEMVKDWDVEGVAMTIGISKAND